MLTQAVTELRKALGDDARAPSFIETVPRRGYRLIAAVSPCEEETSVGGDAPRLGSSFPRWRFGVAVLGLLVLGAFALRYSEPARVHGPELRVAVLPFNDLGRVDGDLVASRVTEELTTRLASLGRLSVISRTSAERAVAEIGSVAGIGEALAADYLLGGSVRLSPAANGGQRVRVTARLVRARDENHLWARAFERPLEELFLIEEEIALQVGEQLGVQRDGDAIADVVVRPVPDAAAYNAYLRARQIWSTDPVAAARLARRATSLDPRFALGHAQLARFLVGLSEQGYGAPDEQLAAAEEAARRALELAPDLPEPHAALAWVHFRGRGDSGRALEEMALALEKEPASAELLTDLGLILRARGRWEEASDAFAASFELDPRRQLDGLPGPCLGLGVTAQMVVRLGEGRRRPVVAPGS